MPVALGMQSAGIRIGSGGGNRNCSPLVSLPNPYHQQMKFTYQETITCVGDRGMVCMPGVCFKWNEK